MRKIDRQQKELLERMERKRRGRVHGINITKPKPIDVYAGYIHDKRVANQRARKGLGIKQMEAYYLTYKIKERKTK